MEIELKELGEITTGNTPSKKDEKYWDSADICFVKPDVIADEGITLINDSSEYISENARGKARVVSKDAVFVTCIGSIGKIGIADSGDYAFNQQINVIEPNEKVLPRYLAYNLLYSKPRLVAIANAPVVPIINKTQFGEFIVNIEEDKTKQAEVVSILDKLAGIIELRKSELESFHDLIKARFVELFGGCKERRKLSEYAELITKGASPRWQGVEYNDNEEGTLFVTSENVREGYIDYSKKKYLPNTINEILPRSVLKRNDVLVNIVNASIGRAAIYESDELANINQAVALVRLRPGVLNVIFLLTFLNSDEAIRSYDRMKVGGDKANLSLKNISDLMVPDVSLEVQNKFADYVKQVDKSKVAVQKSLDETQKLFDRLMQDYFG